MHDMQVTYMVKPPQVNLTQSSTESLMGNGTYILLNTFDQLIHLWPKYVGERDMDWERMGITERIGKMEK